MVSWISKTQQDYKYTQNKDWIQDGKETKGNWTCKRSSKSYRAWKMDGWELLDKNKMENFLMQSLENEDLIGSRTGNKFYFCKREQTNRNFILNTKTEYWVYNR